MSRDPEFGIGVNRDCRRSGNMLSGNRRRAKVFSFWTEKGLVILYIFFIDPKMAKRPSFLSTSLSFVGATENVSEFDYLLQ